MSASSVASIDLSVAVCEMTSVDEVSKNLQQILTLLKPLESERLDLICFPENSLFFRIHESEPRVGLTLEDPAIQRLARWASEHKTTLHLGSVPLMDQGKAYNASLLLTPDGNIQPDYRKIHLFDVDVTGQKSIRESDFFVHGEKPFLFSLQGWKFGSSICYDLRFSELYNYYAREQVDVILIPSAFLVPTGQAHWDILVRARAIESQAYVLAAAQGGRHMGVKGGARATFGHSMIVDPWGVVLAECKDVEAQGRIFRAVLRKDRIAKVRAQIPMASHRRFKS